MDVKVWTETGLGENVAYTDPLGSLFFSKELELFNTFQNNGLNALRTQTLLVVSPLLNIFLIFFNIDRPSSSSLVFQNISIGL